MVHNVPRTIQVSVETLAVVLLLVLLAFYGMPTRASSAPQLEVLDVFTCTPTHVGVFTNRVHVRCNPAAPNNIAYFAYCSAGGNSTTANRFLSAFTTAKVTAKDLTIYFTASDLSGTDCSCLASDCRVLWGAEVTP
jgi:hypothetical protein